MDAVELYRVARGAARQWQSRPGVDVGDVTQEVVAALLEAVALPLPAVVDRPRYFARVAARAAQVYVLTSTAPVRLSKDPATRRASLAALSQAGRQPVTVEELEAVPCARPTADARLADLEWRQAVRRQLDHALAVEAPLAARAARSVLLADVPSGEAAAAVGADVGAVYVVTARAKKRILKSAQGRALWRELIAPEERG